MFKSLISRSTTGPIELVDFDKEFDNAFDMINRMADGVFKKDPFRHFLSRAAYPRTNIRKQGEDAVFEMAIPGYDPKDVEVKLQDGLLTIKGKAVNAPGEYVGEREIAYRAFERSWPILVEAAAVSAEYQRGILSITVKGQFKPEPVRPTGNVIPVDVK